MKTLNLTDKGSVVEALWHAVDDAAGNLTLVPGLVKRVIETRAWAHRVHRGKEFRHARFIDFITAKPLAGCGWPLEKVEALIKDEPEILALWREATTGAKGRPEKPKENAYNISNNHQPVRHGTSRAYTLDRLKRERPDLFERVKAKEISANRAAILAGWRKKSTPLSNSVRYGGRLAKANALLFWRRFSFCTPDDPIACRRRSFQSSTRPGLENRSAGCHRA
jgi:hypothetical protein